MGYLAGHFFVNGGTTCNYGSRFWIPGSGPTIDGNDGKRNIVSSYYYAYFGRYGETIGGLTGVEAYVYDWVVNNRTQSYIANSIYNNATGFDLTARNGAKHRWGGLGACPPPPVSGCTDSRATNYNSSATVDDGSCTYPKPTVSLSASPASYIAPGSSTLSWSASGIGLSSASLTGVTLTTSNRFSGSASVSPGSSTTYTYTANNSGGSSSASVTITVYQPVAATLTVSPTSIVNGSNATLSWSVTGDASSASIDQGIGTVLFSSSQTISPSSTTTYTLNASGLGGSDSDTATITVYQRPELAVTFPGTYDYGIDRQMSVSTTYASSEVKVDLTYLYFGGTTDTATINLTPNESSESGVSIEQEFTPAIPWNDFGPESIDILVTATGLGGTVTSLQTETVNIDRLPENINIPDRIELAPSTDPVVSPDEDTVLSNPLLVDDIDIPVEIRASQPIQVRFDDNDPDIESNWKSLRQIT
ncbi:hypothetical protein [Synechococcus phage S-H9-2]|uniref:Uncharacterized protein n=1 Tax=Synechococcus phage S-H9-2 TaxID=2783669 RepID=A0A873WGB7_9CAUD|nr:virion structural protein [Synechococcus phage S-H9-2]QPB08456.1 hypothetical protein [Synechococcus phage S-H9-2]